MGVPLIDQVKIQAQILVPLVKALQAELGRERAGMGVAGMHVRRIDLLDGFDTCGAFDISYAMNTLCAHHDNSVSWPRG